MCLQAVRAWYTGVGVPGDGVLFVERAGELLSEARLRGVKLWSRSESESEQGVLESRAVDPKPGELPMPRVKRK